MVSYVVTATPPFFTQFSKATDLSWPWIFTTIKSLFSVISLHQLAITLAGHITIKWVAPIFLSATISAIAWIVLPKPISSPSKTLCCKNAYLTPVNWYFLSSQDRPVRSSSWLSTCFANSSGKPKALLLPNALGTISSKIL